MDKRVYCKTFSNAVAYFFYYYYYSLWAGALLTVDREIQTFQSFFVFFFFGFVLLFFFRSFFFLLDSIKVKSHSTKKVC